MSRPQLLVAACSLAVLAACAVSTPEPSRSHIVVVRHAEKADGGLRDPDLSEAGRHRAQALERKLHGLALQAVYATRYRRALQTAQPSADARGLPVLHYDPAQPAEQFVARLHAQHPADAVLVVGHSNTVPVIVSALCQCAVDPLSEEDYGDLFEIITMAGQVTLRRSRF